MPNVSLTQALQAGYQHHQAGRFAEAEAAYRQILAVEPNHADALHLLGLLAQQCGHHDSAAKLLARVAPLKPNDAELHAALGASLGITAKPAEAIAALSRAIQLEPDHADAHNNLGNVYRDDGQLGKAIEHFGAAVTLRPLFYEALFNRGQALIGIGRPADAIADLRAAAQLRPERIDAQRALANALLASKQLAECIELLTRITSSPAATAVDHYNLGVALDESNRRDEAIPHYRRAVELDPNLAEAHYNLGACLSMGLDIPAALESFATAARLKPQLPASDLILHFQHHLPDADPTATFQKHVQWATQFAEPLTRESPPHRNDRNPDRRLRIGYVSADFRRHSVAYFIEPLLAAHDAKQVEIFCYADEIRSDDFTGRIRGHAHAWRNITGAGDADVADIVRRDSIDILIDLAGHSLNNRLLVFARKPAPVQVTYLGYPDTTGMTAMDYRLTDALADPPGAADTLHTERLIRLPDCAWCYRPSDAAPPVEERHEGPLTFGSFNVASKINPPLIALWAKILHAMPQARMLIKTGHGVPGLAHPAILEEFARHHIGPQRIELLAFAPDPIEHLRLFSRVDVALDTFPYNGTTTTCEALWMGVPVVSLSGRTHASRVGVSLLSAIGLSDLVADRPQSFVEIAVAFAQDVNRRAQLRRELRERMKASPLMDAQRLARNVENAYREMWKIWCTR